MGSWESTVSSVKPALKNGLGRFGYQIRGMRNIPRQLLDPKCIRWAEFDGVFCRRMFGFGSRFFHLPRFLMCLTVTASIPPIGSRFKRSRNGVTPVWA